MNILFTHGYSKENRGDASIVSVMLIRVRAMYPEAELKLVTMDKFTLGEAFEGVSLLHAFFNSAIYTSGHSFVRVINTIRVVLSTLLWACVFRLFGIQLNFFLGAKDLETMQAYRQADVLLAVGGGYLVGKNTLHDTVTVILQLHALLVGIILRKPVVLFSQSVGPFGNWIQKVCSTFVLNRTSMIMARESLSVTNLQELRVTKPHIVETADVAFLFKSAEQEEARQILNKLGVQDLTKLVAITLRDWLAPDKQKAYEQTMASFAEYLTSIGYTILFVPQVSSTFHNDDDTIVNNRVKDLLARPNQNICFLPNSLDFKQIKSVFELCKYVVGTRMHSIIFSLTSFVPALAIAYERKTLGVMLGLGLEDYVVPIDEVSLNLLENKFNYLASNSATYQKHLQQNLPIQQEKAESAFNLVSKFITNRHLV